MAKKTKEKKSLKRYLWLSIFSIATIALAIIFFMAKNKY